MKNGAVGHRSLLALTPHDDLGVHRAQATGPLRSYPPPLGHGWMVFGGTSVSSPIVASVFALAGNYGGTVDPRPIPYAHPTGLFDVTTGSDASVPASCSPAYLCNGEPGYDGPTGLGTPNGLTAF